MSASSAGNFTNYCNIGAGNPKPAAETAGRRRKAINAWRHCHYIDPSCVAARYLQIRGIGWLAAPRFRTVLRWRPDARHPSGVILPALFALVTDAAGDADATGNVMAVHRVFLQGDGSGKTDLEPRTASFGPIAGGAIRLASFAAVLVACRCQRRVDWLIPLSRERALPASSGRHVR